jgi:hypothetical protein
MSRRNIVDNMTKASAAAWRLVRTVWNSHHLTLTSIQFEGGELMLPGLYLIDDWDVAEEHDQCGRYEAYT